MVRLVADSTSDIRFSLPLFVWVCMNVLAYACMCKRGFELIDRCTYTSLLYILCIYLYLYLFVFILPQVYTNFAKEPHDFASISGRWCLGMSREVSLGCGASALPLDQFLLWYVWLPLGFSKWCWASPFWLCSYLLE